MFRRCSLVVVVLFAGFATAHSQEGGKEVTLKWKFKEGDKFYVEDVQTTKTDVSILGMQVKEDSKTTTVTSYTIKKVNSDSIVLVQKIEDVEVRSQGGLGGATDKIMEKLKGASFTITLTPEGKVTKSEGFKEFAKKLVGDDDEMSKMIALFFSEELFRYSAESAFDMMPKDPVKKGDSWKREWKVPVPGLGTFKAPTEYTYQGKVEGGDKIGVKQSMVFQIPKGGADLAGVMKITKGNLKSDNAKGHYIFDVEKGRLVSGQMSQFVKGTLTVEFGGQNLDLSMSVDQTTVTRVLDKNPARD